MEAGPLESCVYEDMDDDKCREVAEAMSGAREDGPSVIPWASIKEMKIGGRRKLVPFIGVKGRF